MESVVFTAKSDLPDRSEVIWELYRIIEKLDHGRIRAKQVCSYADTIKNGALKAYIPIRYRQWIEQRTAYIRMVKNNAA